MKQTRNTVSFFKKMYCFALSLLLISSVLMADNAPIFAQSSNNTPTTITGVSTFESNDKQWLLVANEDKGGLEGYSQYLSSRLVISPVGNPSKTLNAYCIDLYQEAEKPNPPDSNEYTLLGLEDLQKRLGTSLDAFNRKASYEGKEDKLRTIITNSYPYLSLDEFRNKLGLPELTASEAVYATQILLWTVVHGGKGLYFDQKLDAMDLYRLQIGSYTNEKNSDVYVKGIDYPQYVIRKRIFDTYTYLNSLPVVPEKFTKNAKLNISPVSISFDSSSNAKINYDYELTSSNSDGSDIPVVQSFVLDGINYTPSDLTVTKNSNKFNVSFSINNALVKNNSTLELKFDATQKISRVDSMFPVTGDRWDTQVLIVAKDERQNVQLRGTKFVSISKPVGYLDFTKADSQTNSPLFGAVIEISSPSEVIIRGTTDEKGKLIKSSITLGREYVDDYGKISLPPASYSYKETVAPQGYDLDSTSYPFNIIKDQTHTSVMKNTKTTVVSGNTPSAPALSGLSFKKVDYTSHLNSTTKPVLGAHIGLYKQDGTLVMQSVTNADGKFDENQTTLLDPSLILSSVSDATLKLANGDYYIKEIQAPDEYLLNDEKINFTVTGNEIIDFSKFTNLKKEDNGILKFVKTDSSGKPLKGAIFTISKRKHFDSSKNISAKPFIQFVTNENGMPSKENVSGRQSLIQDDGTILLYPQVADESYVIQEVKAPTGYNLDSAPKNFDVTKGNVTDITVVNEFSKGKLHLNKLSSQTNMPLADAVIEIHKTSDVGVDEGIVVSSKTNLNGFLDKASATIGADLIDNAGNITLNTGHYYMIETVMPKGYVSKSEKIFFDIAYDEVNTHNLINYLSGTLTFKKIDSQSSSPLKDATVEIYNKDKSILVVKASTNDMGKLDYATAQIGKELIALDGRLILEQGNYFIKETTAPSGYKLDSSEHNFTITNGDNVDINLPNTKIVNTGGGSGGSGGSGGGNKTTTTPNTTSNPTTVNNETTKPQESTTVETTTVDAKTSIKENKKSLRRRKLTTKENKNLSGKIQFEKEDKISISKKPNNGTITIKDDGSWTYIPKNNFVGKDSFVVKITKPNGDEEEVSLEIDVEPIPLASTLPKTGSKAFVLFTVLGLLAIYLGIKKYNEK